MQAPFFSIIIPSYNRSHLIPQAILSVLGQTCSSWELIVIDDGSIDNTAEVVKSFKDARIRYFYQSNAERSAARNNGINRSTGKYICFLDSDDYYESNHLEVLYNEILKTEEPIALFYTGALTKRDNELIQHKLYTNKAEHPVQFVFNNFLLMNSVCVHRNIFETYRFNESLTVWEDNNLWIKILMKFPLIQINEYTTVCVDHSDRGGNKLFKEMDLTVLKCYEDSINDLFLEPGINHFLSNRQSADFLAKKFYTVALIAAWNKKAKIMVECIFNGIRYKPKMLFSASTFKIIKEFSYSILKDLVK